MGNYACLVYFCSQFDFSYFTVKQVLEGQAGGREATCSIQIRLWGTLTLQAHLCKKEMKDSILSQPNSIRVQKDSEAMGDEETFPTFCNRHKRWS